MSVNIPKQIKVYNIIHISKLPAILSAEYLLSDAEIRKQPSAGEAIGMREIKRRRLEELELTSHPGLFVGECVPFYFCPRSIMLYMFYMGNHPDIEYRGGQEPVMHLVADFSHSVEWAEQHGLRWAFTSSNAGAYYVEHYSDMKDLDKVNWDAVTATSWSTCKEEKQAEFLVEERFPWKLVEEIGVFSYEWVEKVNDILFNERHKPIISARKDWYY